MLTNSLDFSLVCNSHYFKATTGTSAPTKYSEFQCHSSSVLKKQYDCATTELKNFCQIPTAYYTESKFHDTASACLPLASSPTHLTYLILQSYYFFSYYARQNSVSLHILFPQLRTFFPSILYKSLGKKILISLNIWFKFQNIVSFDAWCPYPACSLCYGNS